MYLAYKAIKKHRAQKAAAAADAAAAESAFTPIAVSSPLPVNADQNTTSGSNATSYNTSKPKMSTPPASKKPCSQCVQEKSTTRKYRWKLMFCLLPAFFVASLDLTIVATALPQIASHFDKFNQLNWIVTAFTLTATAFIPVWGQVADIFGRHTSLQCAVVLLTIGSVLCAAAPDWPVLLLGRALQGMGTAGIQNVVMIILADSVSLKEQAVNTSIFQLMNGIGYSVGPVIGGYLTNADWRYCFVLCAGMSVISIGTIFVLRKDLKSGSVSLSRPAGNQTRLQALTSGLSTLDFGGITLFILGVGLVILGTAWGGSTFPWRSGAVISTLVLGALLICAFIAYESLFSPGRLLTRLLPRTKPMIPSSILSSKDVALVCSIAAATGAALYSVFYFIGIYFTLVEAYAASRAGTQLLYYVPGLGVGVYLAIFVCNVYPRQTFWPLFLGTIVETAGIATLSYGVKARNVTLVNVMMAIAGAGTGMRFMPSNLHLSGMFRDRLAPVYSLLRFSLPFGGTIALTIMGSVFQNQMSQYFGSNSVNGSIDVHNQASLEAIGNLPIAEQEAIRAQGATATMWAFISILPILGLSLVASMGLGNVWIPKRKSHDEDQEKGEVREDGLCSRHANLANLSAGESAVEAPSGVEFISSSYLLALIRGNIRQLKRPAPSHNHRSVSGEGAHLQEKLSDGVLPKDPSGQVHTQESRYSMGESSH
ncbi:hypothetical protein LTR10_021070 [Elasticomyces elasticus]|uniref:Major facilitator superfamily (MFS) profile domain-containing protein n=1 Tax=Exophiala sideris TaxID=1016849 RepID=A0ABR0JB73_9EURO|nr:hypothetical protein LTR10_021070 [Elasticomyces elasticus]KAK5027790.1 hypothetical protein LTS07_006665 [Exophiala sideris]KAK5037622.1 hypothetical protein LTR13_004781 [Exophiala sideris]KAK5059284.1 hypothetical protein LTR69_006574 [Exophiala sideris]KAK5183118.1 hypothetical protein LTR44_004829 [Eurotiomycetes sp. CCFEE 6388]